MQYLILGATGYIGSYLYRRLLQDGYNTIGTSRCIRTASKMFFYDIQTDNIDYILSKMSNNEEKTAIICIAESKIDKCYENYSRAYDVNVVQTKRVIDKLSKRGFQIVYFSTDNVFDGVRGNYDEEDQTCPINKYGMMKNEIEQYILQNELEASILRIPKVVSKFREKKNIFEEWLNQSKTGHILCIKGNCLTPVYIEDVYQVCLIVAEKKMYGLYNVAGDIAYIRAELIRKFFNKLGIEKIEIEEYDLNEFNFKENRPLNTSMSNSKLKNETGYQFMDMDTVIEMFISNMRLIG